MANFIDGLKEFNNGNYEKAIEIFEQSSKEGDFNSSYRLGQLHLQGFYVKRDVKASSEYFDLAFKQIHDSEPNEMGQYLLGTIYYFGLGTVAKDEQKGFEIFLKCSKSNNINAMTMVASAYMTGVGVDKDCNEAYRILEKIIPNTNHQIAFKLYADCKFNGFGCQKNVDEAIKYYKKSADLGDCNAMALLGDIYHKGKDVKKDDKLAFDYFIKAAKYNYPDAIRNIAYFYANGIGVEKDPEKEVEYLKKYADTGSPHGLFLYGFMCLDPKRKLFKYKEGLDYMKMSAELKDPMALHFLAAIYERGAYGTFPNPGLAFNYYHAAYTLGVKIAAFDVLRCYKNGIGVMKNQAKIDEFEKIVADLQKSNNHQA